MTLHTLEDVYTRRAAGCPATLAAEAVRAGRRWLAGVRHSRRAIDGGSVAGVKPLK